MKNERIEMKHETGKTETRHWIDRYDQFCSIFKKKWRISPLI